MNSPCPAAADDGRLQAWPAAVPVAMHIEPVMAPAASPAQRAVAAGAGVGAAAWLVAWYWPTAQDMVRTWANSSTYSHGFLIVPVCAWLIWRRRRQLAVLPLRAEPRVLPLFVLPGMGWLLGELSGVSAAQHFGMVLMVPLLAWLLFGSAIARALAFPLFFLLFAVPFGDFLLPYLMEQVADVVIAALRLTGVPVYREGQYLFLPSGAWSVVEACAGLRFTIACVTGGALYAYLMYRSTAKRIALVAASVAVPIVANWVRAYGIVMLDHGSGGRFSIASDHIMYGWLFFAAVALAFFWAAARWRDGDMPDEAEAPARRDGGSSSGGAVVAAGIAAAAALAAWPLLAAYVERDSGGARPALAMPDQVGRWRAETGEAVSWTPRFLEPAAAIARSYADGERRSGLYLGYYSDRRRGSDLVNSLNRLVAEHDPWRITGHRMHTALVGGRSLQVAEYRLQGAGQGLLVWQWYWIDGRHTAAPHVAKVLQVREMLLRGRDDGAVVVLYAPYDAAPAAAAEVLAGFAADVLPAIERSLAHAR